MATVGIIGLGIMGGAFARNLMAAGWRVIGYDIDAGQARALGRAGAEIVPGVGPLVREAPILITSLPDTPALAATVAAIVRARARPRLIIETSTFSLRDKLGAERKLKAAGHLLLDCPVSGTGSQAKRRDVVVFASGDPKAIRRLRPLFAGFARATLDLGAFGNGSRMKYVANLLVAIHNVATAEALVLGMKAGLDPRLVFDAVTSGAANSRIFELRGPMMVRNRYGDPTMKVAVWQKDMAVIGAFARELGAPTPLFTASRPLYAAALAAGHGQDDTASVCAVLEAKGGVKRKRAGRSRGRRKSGAG
jgi:putative dehydrogenase